MRLRALTSSAHAICSVTAALLLYLHQLAWQEQHIPTRFALLDFLMEMFSKSRRDWPEEVGICLMGQPAIDERLVEKGAAAMASMGPMAIPTSAVPRAAKSFRPSPQNMTVCCCPCDTTSKMLAAQHLWPCLLSMPCKTNYHEEQIFYYMCRLLIRVEEQTCAACAHDHCAGQNVTGRGQHDVFGCMSNMPYMFIKSDTCL